MVIPIDLPTPHQVPSGPIARARARALEIKVTSLLSDIPYDPLEIWLLPKSMFCMIRYQEDPLEDAREDRQISKFMDEVDRRKEPKKSPGPGHPAPVTSAAKATGPGHLAPAPDIRPDACPGHPAPTQKSGILHRMQPKPPWTSGPLSPDIRPALKAQTSGPCLRTVKGRKSMYPSPP